ncbi:MAG: flagellar motor switch protein FliG [Deltaproteobacteria bacterium]|nr:flagellar motor switch protein FliG [Deltaproteobacteria bacterium]
MAVEEKKIDGLDRAAILMLSLGEDLAAEVMKHMGPNDVQKIGAKLSQIEDVSQESLQTIATDFSSEAETNVPLGDNDFVKKALTKALGSERAEMVIDRISTENDGCGLDALRWMEPKMVADIIKDEHPQTIAVVLSSLEAEQASEIVGQFAPRLRSDVVMRVATMESITPAAMRELEEAIKESLAGNAAVNTKSIGGVKTAAEILNQMDSSSEGAIISEIEKNNVDLATSIQDEMFVFGDIVKIDDRGFQALLKDITSEQLIYALKVADEALKEKFFKNMSERAREMLEEDMEAKGPVKLSEVEKAKKEILTVVKQLEQDGKIVLGGKGGDDELV